MDIQFQQSAFNDYQQWIVDDKKIFSKIGSLIKEITSVLSFTDTKMKGCVIIATQ